MVNPKRVIYPVTAEFSLQLPNGFFDWPLRKEGLVITMAELIFSSARPDRPAAVHNSLYGTISPSTSSLFWLPPRETPAFGEFPIPFPSNIEISVKHLNSDSNI
jgi:hypothetical protein